MDINKALKTAATTGKILYGTKQTREAINGKKAKLIVIAKNCPEMDITDMSQSAKIPSLQFEGTNVDLGAACGKPFSISCLAIVDPGSSPILTGL